MKKTALFLILTVVASIAPAQDHLRNLRNKTSGQISNSPNGTRMDSSFFKARIGVLGRDLAAAVEERALTPYDFATLAIAKDTAVARNRPLLVPWNYTASTLTFRAADSALVLINYGTINVTASDTIPAGAEIWMMRSGRFNISNGYTLRINAQFDGSRRRRFYGGGGVRFGNAAVQEIFPEWFGASNDSTTTIADSGPAFKQAIDSAPNGGLISLANDGRSLNAPGGYVITTTVRIPSDRAITIAGNGSVIYSSGSDTVFFLQNGSQTTLPSYAISPTRDQPRHHIDGIRFKRIASSKAAGIAIAAVNTTGMTISNCDFYDYRNNIVFNNQSDGWCENNDVFNCRIAGADTAISYKVTLAGNNSFATNTLRRVTITAFDSVNARYGVGVYASTSANLYRNVWDQVIVFPRDSVRCFYLNGKAGDLTGNAHIEYIGAKERNQMFGFHFGANASEMRFKLHANITGRRYFNPEKLFYSQIAGNFGFSGITTSFDGNNNHGIAMVVDSTKFTTLLAIVRAHRMGVATPGDSAHIFYAQANNSADGSLDLRARRNTPIDFRSLTDNVYSSATANNVGGSSLPLQPVRLLYIGGRRTADDSTTLDVRNTTDLLFGSNTSTINQLTTFTGGIAGQQLFVNFADDSVSVANLSGASGSGRLFLLGNRDQRMPKGTKSQFFFESESGGVFAREVFRHAPIDSTTWNPANLASGAVDSVDVTYVGAMIGDPVVVGFTGIRTTTADFDLRGHVVTTNTIRVYVRNRNAGTYNLPSGSLKYKVVF